MASTIKVDNIQDQCGSAVVTKCGASKTLTVTTTKANNYQAADGGNIINQCGSTITLGASGDTITLACGASQTGFGRTGTVDWDTTAKTASFTAVSGNGYFVNTTSGAITATLPTSPSSGDIVAIADYAGTAATNNITVARNGSNINGAASDLTISKNNSGCFLVYVDGTQGWKLTETSNLNDIELQPAYIVATGGTITCCGDYKIHTFTGPGTFCVSCGGNSAGSNTVSYLVVAGGGGTSCGGCGGAGGGGAGGFREGKASSDCYTASPLNAPTGLPVSIQSYPIVVGGGGAAGNPGPNVAAGSDSTFSTITSAGGGTSHITPSPGNGGSGGGGASLPYPGPLNTGGTGNTPPVSPSQGNNGGNGLSSPPTGPTASYRGGGGGGAGAVGSNGAFPGNAGNGGAGVTTCISASPTTYAGGGGGGSGFEPGGTQAPGKASGGAGGGGTGSRGNGDNGTAGTANTGGGGGGGGYPCNACSAKAGGSGIVIIRYKYQ